MIELELDLPQFKNTDSVEAQIAIRDFMNDIADYTQQSFQREVPYSSGRMFDHITESRVNKTPFGYTVSIGIEPISELVGGEDEDYPLYVLHGTGEKREGGEAFEAEHGNVMAFYKDTGETVFTRYVKGQEPNDFLGRVEDDVNAYIRVKKRELGQELSKLI